MMKKFLSLFVALTLVFSLSSAVFAFAEELPEATTDEETAGTTDLETEGEEEGTDWGDAPETDYEFGDTYIGITNASAYWSGDTIVLEFNAENAGGIYITFGYENNEGQTSLYGMAVDPSFRVFQAKAGSNRIEVNWVEVVAKLKEDHPGDWESWVAHIDGTSYIDVNAKPDFLWIVGFADRDNNWENAEDYKIPITGMCAEPAAASKSLIAPTGDNTGTLALCLVLAACAVGTAGVIAWRKKHLQS